MKVTKAGQKRALHFKVASKFKSIVQAIRYKRSPYVARTALRRNTIRKPVINNVINLMAKECIRLSRKQSIFRIGTVEKIKALKMSDVTRELRKKAPILYTIVKRACTRRRAMKKSNLNVATMAAALLLKERNKTLCSPQAIISIILYAGHCSKMVRNCMRMLM